MHGLSIEELWQAASLLLHLLLSRYAASQWKRRTSFHWHSNPKQQAHQHDPIEEVVKLARAYLKYKLSLAM